MFRSRERAEAVTRSPVAAALTRRLAHWRDPSTQTGAIMTVVRDHGLVLWGTYSVLRLQSLHQWQASQRAEAGTVALVQGFQACRGAGPAGWGS